MVYKYVGQINLCAQNWYLSDFFVHQTQFLPTKINPDVFIQFCEITIV